MPNNTPEMDPPQPLHEMKPSPAAQPSPVGVVLVEPRIPQNTGNIARLCACTGVPLYLVGDLGFRMSDKYLNRAGMDYMEDVQMLHVPDFPQVLERHPNAQPYYFSTRAQHLYTEVAYPVETLLVFGSETTGLPQRIIDAHPNTTVRLPMRPTARSLNLSTSVAIALYEYLRQHPLPHLA